VLQGIRQGEMTRILEGVCSGDGGAERADCLMKYLYVELLFRSPGALGGGKSWI
jgi:actin related protein 2/3 complex subunit 5